MQPERHKFLTACVLAGCVIFVAPQLVLTQPEVPDRYKKYIVHRVDRRSFPEKALNLIGISQQSVGRSFALIAGVSKYPHMSGPHADLNPAAWDIANLTNYLQSHEFFDEIVVLTEKEVTIEHLNYFLTDYFPQRLESFPKSRFLFAYSGHGMTRNNSGYLLTSQARHLGDRSNSIKLDVVRSMFEEIINSGAHHVLALINSCYSGSFLRRPFGGNRHYLPRHPGAHAITAGGTGELTWHDASVGKGSIFFEKFFAGLDGHADLLPKQPDGTSGDGIVTVDELMLYLRQEVSSFTDQQQNPSLGDLSMHGSQGGLFFLNRRRQVEHGVLPKWLPPKINSFGSGPSESLKEAILHIVAVLEKQRLESLSTSDTSLSDLPQEITTRLGMEFVLIPAGTFTMGSPDSDANSDRGLFRSVFSYEEKPAHQVTISEPFYMGKYEVTQAQWKAVMGENPSRFKGDDRPIENVSWEDVQQFIQKLNKREGKEACRLPTEAEWEYAARAGTTTIYSFGDNESQLGDYAWYAENSGNTTHLVGEKKPNPWGLYDMHGNIWEWVEDGGRTYTGNAVTDPKGPANAGAGRVIRGGGWYSPAQFARSAYRLGLRPGARDVSLGFRCLSSVLSK